LHLGLVTAKLRGMPGRRIELCGVSVDVETDHAEFEHYLEGQFPRGDAAASRAADLAVRVRWTEGGRDEVSPEAVFPGWPVPTRIHRYVFAGAGRVICLEMDDAPEIALASATGTPRRFELRYHFSLGAPGWRESAKRALRWRRIPALRRRRLSTLAYYAIYYTVWWHLEAQGLAHPLHAAAVAIDGRGLLLAGLPGCGKSTLAASFLGAPRAELLSDNVVLHDGAQIFGCFEPLLLDAATRDRLTERVPIEAVGRRHQYARDAFHAPHREGGVPLGAAVMLARGRETRLERLPARECARLLLAANEGAKEIRRYHVLASLLAIVERDGLRHLDQRLAHLDALLGGVPCYWLEVREGAPAEGIGVLRELAGTAREAAS
jgi:hypothetical protein